MKLSAADQTDIKGLDHSFAFLTDMIMDLFRLALASLLVMLPTSVADQTLFSSRSVRDDDMTPLDHKTLTSPVLSGDVLLSSGAANFLTYQNSLGYLIASKLFWDGFETYDILSSNNVSPNFELTNTFNGYAASYYTARKQHGAGGAVRDGDQIMNFLGKPWTGMTYQDQGADISFYVDGNVNAKNHVGTKIYLNTDSGTNTLSQWLEYDHAGHVGNKQETNPQLSECGKSPSLREGSTDAAGALTMGTGTAACTLTFATPFRGKPFCVLSETSPSQSFDYSVSEKAISIASAVSYFAEISWMCWDSRNPG